MNLNPLPGLALISCKKILKVMKQYFNVSNMHLTILGIARKTIDLVGDWNYGNCRGIGEKNYYRVDTTT